MTYETRFYHSFRLAGVEYELFCIYTPANPSDAEDLDYSIMSPNNPSDIQKSIIQEYVNQNFEMIIKEE